MIHMVEDDVRCFTRNSNEYTLLYGPFLKKLRAYIKAETCILDGEMLGWDRRKNSWLPFGNNTTLAQNEGGQVPENRHVPAAQDKKQAKSNKSIPDAHLCLILFDVLLIGDERLENKPLEERRKRLVGLIDSDKVKVDQKSRALPDGKVLEVVEHKVASTLEQVKEELSEVVLRDEEGIMLKDPGSVYKANVRERGGWFKLKPEYVLGGTQEYDVVIIGGSHGKNLRSGTMWTLVCGICERRNNAAGGQYPTEFVSFTRIGTGLKREEFQRLEEKLKPLKRSYDQREYSRNCVKKDGDMTIERTERGVKVQFDAAKIKGEEMPAVTVWFAGNAQEEVEVVFDPRKSVVLTLIADYRLTEGNVWMAGRDSEAGRDGKRGRGWTLRFPRVAPMPRGIRDKSLGGDEKPWYDVMSTKEFDQQIKSTKDGSAGAGMGKGFQAGLKAGETTFGKRAKKPAIARAAKSGSQVIQGRENFDPKETMITSDALNGCIVCVYAAAPGQDGSKARLETQRMLHELGATQVANDDTFTTHIICMCEDQKFKNLKDHDKDIVDPSWVAECYENRACLPLEPRHMKNISSQRKDEFSELFDRYEDSYTRDITKDELSVKLEKEKLWDDDRKAGFDLKPEGKSEIENALRSEMIAEFCKREGRQTAALPLPTLESQPMHSLPGASLEASQVCAGGEFNGVHDLVSWSLFREVHAVFLDNIGRHIALSASAAGAPDFEEVADSGAKSRAGPPWIAVARALLIAGGAHVDKTLKIFPTVYADKPEPRRLSKGPQQLESIARSQVTHVVCSEKLLKGDRKGVEGVLGRLGISKDVAVVTDRWIENCARYKKLLPDSEEHLFSAWEAPRPREDENQLRSYEDQLHTFVSCPYSHDPSLRSSDDVASPDWLSVKAKMTEEVDATGEVLEYLRQLEVTDGMKVWRTPRDLSYQDFESDGKLPGEVLDTWDARVCEVLRFPWGVSARYAPPHPHGITDCVWRFSDRAEDWKRDWSHRQSQGPNGRELCITWTNRGGRTHSNFVVWLQEVDADDALQAMMLETTTLLVTQCQHTCDDIESHQLLLHEAQHLQKSAEKWLVEFEKNEAKDIKLVTNAGVSFINAGKRPFQKLEEEEELAERAAGYDTDDEDKDEDPPDGMADEGGAAGDAGGSGTQAEGASRQCNRQNPAEAETKKPKPKPRPRPKKSAEAEPETKKPKHEDY